MEIKIPQDELDALARKLNNIDKLAAVLAPPMIRSLALLQDDIAQYPRKKPGAFSSLATPGQKRAYWTQVSRGVIDHRDGIGYVRTTQTGKSWTAEVQPQIDGWRGILGNNAPGARWVYGTETQQPFHKASGFPTVSQVAEKNRRAIVREFQTAIRRELAK